MKTLLVVGLQGKLPSRLAALLEGECAALPVQDSADALRYLREHGGVPAVVSAYRSWRPEDLAALRKEFPAVKRIDVVPRRTRRQIRLSLREEGHFAVLGETANDTELLHALYQALGPATGDEEYRIAPGAESTIAERAPVHAAAQEDFLLMVAHDIRTAVSVIAGYAHVLLDPASQAAESAQLLRRIQNSSARLIGLVDSVVRITLIGMGQASLRREPARPARLIRSAVEDLSGLAEARGQTIVQRVEGEGEPREVDRHLVLLVLRNLLDNAIKYTDAGGRITVKGRSEPDGLAFEIDDTGRGIAPDHLESIFTRLTRFPAGAHEKGSGLGLWAAKKVVELHGGRIWVESAPGRGSSFRFTVKTRDSAASGSEPAGSLPS